MAYFDFVYCRIQEGQCSYLSCYWCGLTRIRYVSLCLLLQNMCHDLLLLKVRVAKSTLSFDTNQNCTCYYILTVPFFNPYSRFILIGGCIIICAVVIVILAWKELCMTLVCQLCWRDRSSSSAYLLLFVVIHWFIVSEYLEKQSNLWLCNLVGHWQMGTCI